MGIITLPSFSFLLSYPEFLLAAVSFLAISSLRAARRRHRHAVPVPVSWPVVGMLPFVVSNLGHLLDAATGALRELGCTFMFRGPWLAGGADFLVTCDPAILHHCLVANHSNYDKGHDFAEMFDVVGEGLLVADAASWAPQRRLAAAVFSSAAFRSFVLSTVVRQTRRLLVPFLEHVANGRLVEMEEVLMRYSFDVSYAVAFAADVDSLSVANAAAAFPAFGEATRVTGEAVMFRHIVPARVWKVMRWLNVGVERRLADAKAVLDESVYREIANRKKKSAAVAGEGHDLLSMYMAYPRDADMTDEERDRSLRDAAVGFMFAAKDLIAAAMTWLLYMLATHPRVEAKILAELTSLHHHHHAGGDGEHREHVVFDGEAVRSATYLHAVVLETLRLYPPAPFEEKEATGDDELPGGTTVRKGTRVVFCLYAMGRVEGIWGEDCWEFRPERWLTGTGKIRQEPTYKFATFNAGPRSCLGRDLGITNIKIATAAIVYNFRVELAGGGHVVEPKDSVVLHTKNGLMVRVKRREEAA
uniref:Cytochrome P450 n=1 Tax=Leersia perrieri TaxID=77586 RepID=A0A0D9WDG8_9ORYZ